MIYVNKEDVSEKGFVDLLAKTRQNSLSELSEKSVKELNPNTFENFIYERMVFSAKKSDFEGQVVQTGPHAFPDIIAKKYYGTEVKMTTGDKWISTGNSVLETTRDADVQRIYILFGKLGGKVDIKYRPYQDCMYDIGVTHSPRYKINMDLGEGETIFSKIGIEYDILRKDNNPIRIIKDYYRGLLEEGEELWWIDPQADNGDASVSPVIKSFKNLNESERRKFIAEAMILFPEMFGPSSLKYERAAVYLITAYNAVSSSLRDNFTSGGQEEMDIKGKKISVPKIFYNMSLYAKDIQSVMDFIDEEKLKYYWRVSEIEKSRVEQWKKILDQTSKLDGVKASDIFEQALK